MKKVVFIIGLLIALGGASFFVYPMINKAKQPANDNEDSSAINQNINGDIQDNEKKFEFEFTNSDGTKNHFEDGSITCFNATPTTELSEINGDGKDEIIANCNSGAVSSAAFALYVYKLKDNSLSLIGSLDSEGKYEIKDCNSDGIKDIVTYIRDVPHGSGSNAEMTREMFCNSWDKSKNEFIETSLGEE